MKKMKTWIAMLLMASLHIVAGAANPGDVRSVTQINSDCSKGIALEGCLGAPTPRPCPSGYHWSLEGSGIAHCVMDDPVCPPDEDLIHDAQGNPSCVAKPKCANGGTDFPICTKPTCANGGTDYPTCTDPVTPTCPNGATDFPVCTQPVCPNGGSDYPTCTNPVKPTCSNGGTDYPVCTQPVCANGAFDYPTCTDPTPKCTNGGSDYPVCTQPVCPNGAKDYPTCTETTTTKCANGAADYPTCISTETPTCVNGAQNYPDCSFSCPPDKSEIGACPSGFIGSALIKTTYAQNTCIASTSIDTSGCVISSTPQYCQNGATNYPTCTFPRQLYCGTPQSREVTTLTEISVDEIVKFGVNPKNFVGPTVIAAPDGWYEVIQDDTYYTTSGFRTSWTTNYQDGGTIIRCEVGTN